MAGLNKNLHAEISPLGLRSTCIEPGYFRTNLLTTNNFKPFTSRIPAYEKTGREMQEQLQGKWGQYSTSTVFDFRCGIVR